MTELTNKKRLKRNDASEHTQNLPIQIQNNESNMKNTSDFYGSLVDQYYAKPNNKLTEHNF